MFEISGMGRLNMSRSMGDMSGARSTLATRSSESRLNHIAAAERDLTGREIGAV